MVIIAGANGTGKTTFAKSYLETQNLPFLNADEIAKELNSSDVNKVQLAASREYFKRLNLFIEQGKSFVVESTISGQGLLKWIEKLKGLDYQVEMVYLFLASPEACIHRVRGRVLQGGHNVPEKDIRRRYVRSKYNFWKTYRCKVDKWLIYSNDESGLSAVAKGDSEDEKIFNERLLRDFLK